MLGEEDHRIKGSNRYSNIDDDEDLQEVEYDEYDINGRGSLLKNEIDLAVKHHNPQFSGNYTKLISDALDDEKRLIDEKITRQVIEDSYKLPTEHIMKYSTLDQQAKNVILDDLTNYYDEENKELKEILVDQRKYKNEIQELAFEDQTDELKDNKSNINFYDKEAKLLDERIGIMKNRIQHLELNNEHVQKKVEQMDKKKDFYLEKRLDKLKREAKIEEMKRNEEEEIKRKIKANNAFFAQKSKEKTIKELKNDELSQIKQSAKAEKDLLVDLNEKQSEFNQQKNEQKILMMKIDKAAKETRKAEDARTKYAQKKEESKFQLITAQNKNEELRTFQDDLEKKEKAQLEKLNKTLCNQNKSFQTLADIKNKKLTLGDVESQLQSKISEKKVFRSSKRIGSKERLVSTSASRKHLANVKPRVNTNHTTPLKKIQSKIDTNRTKSPMNIDRKNSVGMIAQKVSTTVMSKTKLNQPSHSRKNSEIYMQTNARKKENKSPINKKTSVDKKKSGKTTKNAKNSNIKNSSKVSKSLKKRNIDEELRSEYLSLAKLREKEEKMYAELRASHDGSLKNSRLDSNTKLGYSNQASLGHVYSGNAKTTVEKKMAQRYNDNKQLNSSGDKDLAEYYTNVRTGAKTSKDNFRTPNQFYTPKDINQAYAKTKNSNSRGAKTGDQNNNRVVEFEMDYGDSNDEN